MASNSQSRSKFKTVSREIILGCVEGGLKAMSLIDKNDMVVEVVTTKHDNHEFIIRIEKE